MDGRSNNGGARPNSGSKGYGKQNFIKERVKQYEELWWTIFAEMLSGSDKDDRKFAMGEFNKIQSKMVPTLLGNEDGAPLIIQVAKEVLEKNAVDESTSNDSEGHS